MKMFKNVLMPADYLGEKCNESANGNLSFSVSVIRNFCDTYTNIDYDMLGSTQKLLLKHKMVDIAGVKGFPGRKNEAWDGKKIEINLPQ